MPSKTMASQNGNSCAAHCTEIAIAEIKGGAASRDSAELAIWPLIKFIDQGGASTMLAAQGNSDPRRIVSVVESTYKGVSAKLMCDNGQKRTAMSFVAEAMRPALESLFSLLTQKAVAGPVQLEECVFYNCSFTMHSNGTPSANNFTGLHNMLVVYEGSKACLYNSNEDNPAWTQPADWKILKNQNGGNCSYVFTGVSVALF